MRNIVAVGAVTSVLVLGGCGGAVIKKSIGPGSPFCTDLATFATQVAPLADAAAETRPALLQTLPPIHALLVKMQAEAPTADTVNGKPLKADVMAVAGIYADLITALQNASATDPAAVRNALAAVYSKQGLAVTNAVNRLDAYTKPVCGVTTASATSSTTTSSTTAPTSTTVAPLGPVAPSTTASPATTPTT
jgi:hypothetical protein